VDHVHFFSVRDGGRLGFLEAKIHENPFVILGAGSEIFRGSALPA
jgi:hypothetical protein